MFNYFTKVLEWLYAAKPNWYLPTTDSPSMQDIQLIVGLCNEEVGELHAGMLNNDKLEIKDAIIDLMWVALNAAALFRITPFELTSMADAVMESNFSKFTHDENIAKKTVLDYQGNGVEAYYTKINDYYIIYRKSDNKILKSIDYKPVTKILNNGSK